MISKPAMEFTDASQRDTVLYPRGGPDSFLSLRLRDLLPPMFRPLIMRTHRFAICLSILLFCVAANAQDAYHPNFTGIWKLDPQRSVFNGQVPDSATLYIHQNDPDFHLRRTEVHHGKSSAWSVHGRTDGKALERKSRQGIQRTQMYWQGSELILEWKSADRYGETRKTVHYTLSDGGKTLVAQEEDDNHRSTWVFTRSG